MKTTENSLLLNPGQLNAPQQESAFAKRNKPAGIKSARPMKSMVRLKSVRPQKIEINGKIRKRTIKL